MIKILLIAMVFCGSAFSAKNSTKPAVQVIGEVEKKILTKINAKLEQISNMKASFRQQYGKKAEKGYFEFKRNYGIYIKYETMPVTLLANKDVTTYYDSKMDQKSEIPTKDSATKIFTNSTLIDDKMFDILEVSENAEAYFVRATVKRMKAEGVISMYFSKADLLIRRIDIKTPEEESIRIDIYSHIFSDVSPERFKAINIKNAKI